MQRSCLSYHFSKILLYIRRSCASIPANIAEGCSISRDAELCHFHENFYGFKQ
ncbi:four helix bundle protein [Dapis sp. BLCC M126]|uniref:four helix bundle protein n=1 Tax=Dapis sp. BLCC M126 TaxID=3400189 RepID=UPI003CEA2EA1